MQGSGQQLPESYRRLLEELRARGPMEVKALAEALGLRPSTVRRYVLELERIGLVARRGGLVVPVATGRDEASEPLYALGPRGPVLLRVRSLTQLAAALHYGLLGAEEAAYMVSTGILAAWVRCSVGDNELAESIEKLRGMPPGELLEALRRLLSPYLSPP